MQPRTRHSGERTADALERQGGGGSQTALPGLESAPSLTERQSAALEFICAASGPVRADLLGAFLHERRLHAGERGGHSRDFTCTYCAMSGKDVGHALRKKGFVRYLRGAGFVAAEYVVPVEGYDPRTADIPF